MTDEVTNRKCQRVYEAIGEVGDYISKPDLAAKVGITMNSISQYLLKLENGGKVKYKNVEAKRPNGTKHHIRHYRLSDAAQESWNKGERSFQSVKVDLPGVKRYYATL